MRREGSFPGPFWPLRGQAWKQPPHDLLPCDLNYSPGLSGYLLSWITFSNLIWLLNGESRIQAEVVHLLFWYIQQYWIVTLEAFPSHVEVCHHYSAAHFKMTSLHSPNQVTVVTHLYEWRERNFIFPLLTEACGSGCAAPFTPQVIAWWQHTSTNQGRETIYLPFTCKAMLLPWCNSGSEGKSLLNDLPSLPKSHCHGGIPPWTKGAAV